MKRFISSWLTWFFTVFVCANAINGFHAAAEKEPGSIALWIQGLTLSLVLGLWVRKDAAKRNVAFPTDVLILSISYWIIPLYILHSRGWKGLLFLLICLAVLIALIVVAFMIAPLPV